MLYFLFYKRKLPKKMLSRIEQFNNSLIINDDTTKESLYMNDIYFKDNLLSKFIWSVVRIFAPLL